MADISANRMWQFLTVGSGLLLLLFATMLPFLIYPADVARMARLESEGILSPGRVTGLEHSRVQTPRHPTVGTYLLVRGLGGSRKAAMGTALITRSASKSAARAQDAGPGYYDIEYEFRWARGETATGTDRVMLTRSHSLDVGSDISVLHDARDPTVHRLPGHSKATDAVSPILTYGPAFLIALLGGFLVWWGLQLVEGDTIMSSRFATLSADPPAGRYARGVAPQSQSTPSGAVVRRARFNTAPAAPPGFGPRSRV